MPDGYSETPLAKKLNLRDGQRVWFDSMPESVQEEIGEYALDLIFVSGPTDALDAAHIFVKTGDALNDKLAVLRESLDRKGQVWVSWPRQASGIASEIGEHEVREAGLALGFVDTKECVVDEVWSGIKFAIRKELR